MNSITAFSANRNTTDAIWLPHHYFFLGLEKARFTGYALAMVICWHPIGHVAGDRGDATWISRYSTIR
jgi:hypothetical protein